MAGTVNVQDHINIRKPSPPQQIPLRAGEPLVPLCPPTHRFWKQQHRMMEVNYVNEGWVVGYNAVCMRCGYVAFWPD